MSLFLFGCVILHSRDWGERNDRKHIVLYAGQAVQESICNKYFAVGSIARSRGTEPEVSCAPFQFECNGTIVTTCKSCVTGLLLVAI